MLSAGGLAVPAVQWVAAGGSAAGGGAAAGGGQPGVRWRGGRGPGLVVGLLDARQFLQEGDDRPDLVVFGAGKRKARHAGHVDAVLDHPEQLRGRAIVNDFLQVRRIGMQAFRKLGPIDAGRAMAVGAAERGCRPAPGLHAGGIADAGGRKSVAWRSIEAVRTFTKRPIDDPRVFSGSGDTVVAAKEEHCCADANDNCKRANKSENTHERPQYFKTRELYRSRIHRMRAFIA